MPRYYLGPFEQETHLCQETRGAHYGHDQGYCRRQDLNGIGAFHGPKTNLFKVALQRRNLALKNPACSGHRWRLLVDSAEANR